MGADEKRRGLVVGCAGEGLGPPPRAAARAARQAAEHTHPRPKPGLPVLGPGRGGRRPGQTSLDRTQKIATNQISPESPSPSTGPRDTNRGRYLGHHLPSNWPFSRRVGLLICGARARSPGSVDVGRRLRMYSLRWRWRCIKQHFKRQDMHREDNKGSEGAGLQKDDWKK